jgi:hypothetical protein
MKQESVIFIFVVFVLLWLTPSCLRGRTTCMRHRLKRRGSGSRHPWSVSAIERCSVAAHAPWIGCSHAAGIPPPRRSSARSSLLEHLGTRGIRYRPSAARIRPRRPSAHSSLLERLGTRWIGCRLGAARINPRRPSAYSSFLERLGTCWIRCRLGTARIRPRRPGAYSSLLERLGTCWIRCRLRAARIRPRRPGAFLAPAATAKPGEFAGKGVVAARETSTTALPSAGAKNPGGTNPTGAKTLTSIGAGGGLFQSGSKFGANFKRILISE